MINLHPDDFNGNQITNPNSIQINAELTKVMDWLTVNKLSLNIKNTKMMIFCSKQRILKTTEIPSVIINHMPIERVTCFTFLGVIIDSNLTWSHHINYISNKLTRLMWSFVKIKTLCTCINSENNLQFTISISPKLWNNSMGFQCWPTHKNIAKKGNQIHI